MHGQRDCRGDPVRANQTGVGDHLRAFATVHLLQRTGDRRDRRFRLGRDDSRWHQKRGGAGRPPETDWPYDITLFAVEPPPSAYADAASHKLLQYQRVLPRLNQIKSCLAAGFPFVFGFTVYESFESDAVAATGVVPMPGTSESVLGGHAVMAAGYDDSQMRLIVRNSWGSGWGQAGYFTMPYAYVLDSDLASDFWTLRSVA